MTERGKNALQRVSYWAEVCVYDTEAAGMAASFCDRFAAEALRYGASQAEVDAVIGKVTEVARA
jgi:hypothetical protein